MKRALLAVVLLACTPTTPPAPPDVVVTTTDASSPCISACANLARLGCAEGDGLCGSVCQRLSPQRAMQAPIAFDVACIAAATSKASVRVCMGMGPTSCP